MSKPATKKTAKTAAAEPVHVEDLKPADLYPLSARATFAQVQEAGICNGMSAEECEDRLSRIMS